MNNKDKREDNDNVKPEINEKSNEDGVFKSFNLFQKHKNKKKMNCLYLIVKKRILEILLFEI